MTLPAARPISVVLVEDDPLCHARMAQALRACERVQLVAHFVDGRSALAWLEGAHADVLLCDLGLPDLPGLAVITYCAQRHPQTDIMVITMYEDEAHVMQALQAGAVGYLLKDSLDAEIVQQVENLHAGGAPMSPVIARLVLRHMRGTGPQGRRAPVDRLMELTARELLVLNRVAQGFSYAEIAQLEGISTHTVHSHVKRIYGKLSVHSRSQAVFEAQALGLIDHGLHKP